MWMHFLAGQVAGWTLLSGRHHLVGHRMRRGQSARRVYAHLQVRALDTGACQMRASISHDDENQELDTRMRIQIWNEQQADVLDSCYCFNLLAYLFKFV